SKRGRTSRFPPRVHSFAAQPPFRGRESFDSRDAVADRVYRRAPRQIRELTRAQDQRSSLRQPGTRHAFEARREGGVAGLGKLCTSRKSAQGTVVGGRTR